MCSVPPTLVRGKDTLAGWRGGWGVNILEDARNSSVVYISEVLGARHHLLSCLFTCRACSVAETCSWSGSTRRWRRWARPPAAAAARLSR